MRNEYIQDIETDPRGRIAAMTDDALFQALRFTCYLIRCSEAGSKEERENEDHLDLLMAEKNKRGL